MQDLIEPIEEMAAAARESLGEERLAWLDNLPLVLSQSPVALVHASPADTWRSPMGESGVAELESVYGRLGQPIAVYGHIHQPYIRNARGLTVINSGSVSLSYDGDRRAANLLLEDSRPTIRRVEYDLGKEIRALADSSIPRWEWIARILESARPEMP